MTDLHGGDDRFQLQRFVDAQASVFDTALAELEDGMKQSHWMWFIFPQIAGLGAITMAQRYAIGSLDEAAAYLAHPVLGPRLHTCMKTLLALKCNNAVQILGATDARKLQSCASLFTLVSPDESVFERVLQRYFGGVIDAATLAIIERRQSSAPL